MCVCVRACVLSHSTMSDSAAPLTEAHQAPLSTGYSRQEYWSGLPALLQGLFPNPGLPHCRIILHHLSHRGSPRILEWVANPSSEELTEPGIEPGSSSLQVDSLPAELPGKPIYI